jgi:hypothetical protein
LPALLFLSKVVVLALLDDWTICSDHVVDCFFAELKDFLWWVAVVEIIKEDTTESTSFASVWNQKVFLGPFLELWVVCSAVPIANILLGAMKVLHIILVTRYDGVISVPPPNHQFPPFGIIGS